VNSKDGKRFVVRVKSWVQSHWLQPDGSICQEYLVISVATLTFAFLFATPRADILLVVVTLILGLTIASLVKHALWRERKLLIARDVLLQLAFYKCCCGPNAVITENPIEIESVGKTNRIKCYCSVCETRAFLREEFPGAIQQRVREVTLQKLPVEEDLMSWLTPSQRIILEDERGSGWKIPFGPDWGERR
jgi:hypothetical protein